MTTNYTYSIGRRKTATAQVKLFTGKGNDIINGIEVNKYIKRSDLFEVLYKPLSLCKLKDKFYFEVIISGSGSSAQAQAISHGLSVALASIDSSNKQILKQAGMLTRDSRKVERKKPGLHKARKAMQWSKR